MLSLLLLLENSYSNTSGSVPFSNHIAIMLIAAESEENRLKMKSEIMKKCLGNLSFRMPWQ